MPQIEGSAGTPASPQQVVDNTPNPVPSEGSNVPADSTAKPAEAQPAKQENTPKLTNGYFAQQRIRNKEMEEQLKSYQAKELEWLKANDKTGEQEIAFLAKQANQEAMSKYEEMLQNMQYTQARLAFAEQVMPTATSIAQSLGLKADEKSITDVITRYDSPEGGLSVRELVILANLPAVEAMLANGGKMPDQSKPMDAKGGEQISGQQAPNRSQREIYQDIYNKLGFSSEFTSR